MAKKVKNTVVKGDLDKIEFKDFIIESGKTGATTKLFVDGKRLGNCISATFKASARGLNTLTLVVIPSSVKINGSVIVKVEEFVLKDKNS